MSYDTTNCCMLCEQHSREAIAARTEVQQLIELIEQSIQRDQYDAPFIGVKATRRIMQKLEAFKTQETTG